MTLVDAVLLALADAFMEVGVFVAVLVAAFGWIRWRYGEQLIVVLERHRRWGPFIGAALGVSPGCAGAILLMPLYARKSVSFGTVIAGLVATMGDSSWVIMAANPRMAAVVHTVLFVTGLVTGYTVDVLRIGPRLRGPQQVTDVRDTGRPAGPAAHVTLATRSERPVTNRAPTGLARTALALQSPIASTSALFWLLACCGFVVAFPTAFQMVDAATLTTWSGGVDPYLTLGIAGSAVATVLFVRGKGRLADDTVESASATAANQPFTAVLRHGAHETSFVVVWVAVAYVAWACVHVLTGFDGSQLPLLGIAGVLVGALIGLVPGCAVQIVFTGLYVSGAVPLPTLLANAISQDGDALLPLIALEKYSALVATCITTVPGLLVGTLAWLVL
ncbi:MAG TPA: putative manganese transporter [Nocardioidaceae bacterium]|nr:putative manganese transporter [Nocardioidaceae bacterium]